jgi:hypothetical protein
MMLGIFMVTAFLGAACIGIEVILIPRLQQVDRHSTAIQVLAKTLQDMQKLYKLNAQSDQPLIAGPSNAASVATYAQLQSDLGDLAIVLKEEAAQAGSPPGRVQFATSDDKPVAPVAAIDYIAPSGSKRPQLTAGAFPQQKPAAKLRPVPKPRPVPAAVDDGSDDETAAIPGEGPAANEPNGGGSEDIEDKRTTVEQPPAKPSASSGGSAALLSKGAQSGEVTWRRDGKCGPLHKNRFNQDGTCNPASQYPCCAPSGWCGDSEDHCSCVGCTDYRPVQAIAPSHTGPKSIVIVVPLRDRGVHYAKFISHFNEFIPRQPGNHRWTLIFVEQFDEALFNRGWLFNVGMRMAMQEPGLKPDCMITHDVDNLPFDGVDYSQCQYPIQLSSEIKCWKWAVPYPNNVGGVVSGSPAHWKRINGFSSSYQGWGGEDDDLYWRLKHNQLLKGGCFPFFKTNPGTTEVLRPGKGHGKFDCMDDGDHTPRRRGPDDRELFNRLEKMRGGSDLWKNDGLSNLKFVTVRQLSSEPKEVPQPGAAIGSTENAFSLRWASVRPQGVFDVDRLRLLAPSCGTETHPVPSLPLSLAELSRMIHKLWPECHPDKKIVGFLVLDLDLGHVSVPVDDWQLGRWLRQLPAKHEGLLIAQSKPPELLKKELLAHSRLIPRTTYACIGKSDFSDAKAGGKKKYRIKYGSDWCGDQGWSADGHFHVYHKDDKDLVPDLQTICYGYSPQGWVYHVKARGNCSQSKSDGDKMSWRHEGVVYTSQSARGQTVCVGKRSGATDSSIALASKSSSCPSLAGFGTDFTFNGLEEERGSALARICPSKKKKKGAESGLHLGGGCGYHHPLVQLEQHKPDDRTFCLEDNQVTAGECSGDGEAFYLPANSRGDRFASSDGVEYFGIMDEDVDVNTLYWTKV